MLVAQANQGASGWLQTTAGSWFVLTETNSTTAIAFFTVASMTPSLLLNPVGGRLMDRHSPIAMVKLLAPLAAVGPLLIALLYFLGQLTTPLILLLTVVAAVPRALQAPTFAKILPLTVPDEQRADVLGLSAIVFNLSRTVGPLIAGFAGTQLAFVLAGVGYLLVAAIVFVTPIQESDTARPSATSTHSKQVVGYREAIRITWAATVLKTLFFAGFVFYLVSGALHQLLAAVAKDTSSTSVALGVLYACAAVGAMVTNPPTIAYLRRDGDRLLLLSMAILGIGLVVVLFGLSPMLVTDAILMVFAGALGEIMYLSAQRSILLESDEALSGAIFGLFLALLTGATILGSLGLGLMMDVVGVRTGLVLLGAATLVLMVPILVRLLRHRAAREVPEGSGAGQ